MKGTSEHSHLDIWIRPRPEVVAQVFDECGPAAALERWHWLSWDAIQKIGLYGRQIRRARLGVIVRSATRSTTPEQEAAAVEAAQRLGSLKGGAESVGLSEAVVRRVFRERGLPVPTMSRSEVSRRAAETRHGRAA
ncbi:MULTISPECIES: hypothetical protein [unclassified Methylobacterium]|uniref:hypothetical protein n=1 Tax=unclassified Methylobacterium TaxID=2615210 RepID=UPI002269D646|nr:MULTISPECIES: hypothetical protein [unclassified Methylobacterium]